MAHPALQSPDLVVVKAKAPAVKEYSATIHQLAAASNQPVPVVEEMYLHERSLLEKEATIDTYVDLLTERKVRETLRHKPPLPR
jgi:hypothetical protein